MFDTYGVSNITGIMCKCVYRKISSQNPIFL